MQAQQLDAPRDFALKLEAALCAQDAARLSGQVSAAEAAAALEAVDPLRSAEGAETLVACGFGSHAAEPLNAAKMVDIGAFCDTYEPHMAQVDPRQIR